MIHYSSFVRFYNSFLKPKISRHLYILAVFFLSSQLIISCTNPFAEKVQLRFIVQPDAEYWNPRIEEFESRNPNITIELANFNGITPTNTDEVRKEYIKSFTGKSNSFDLVYIDVVWLPEYANNKWLTPLDVKDFPDLNRDFLKREVEDGFFDQKLYRIPFRTDAGVLFYRKDLLEKLNRSGIETFDELLQTSQELQKQKTAEIGFLWQGRHYEGLSAMFVEVLEGYGGFWINDKNEVGLNKSEAIRAVQFLQNTIKTKVSPTWITSYEEETTVNSFRQDDAVFMRHWPNVWVDVNNSNSLVRGKVGIQAMVHAEGKTGKATIGGWGLGIAEQSKHKDQALKAIKFFTSTEIQRKFALNAGFVPTRKSLFYDPEIVSKYNHFPKLKEIIENNGTHRPQITEYSKVSSILQDCLSQVLNDKMTAQKAMSTAYDDTTKLLKNGSFSSPSCNWKK
jgi:multiple sugar transport system substrate-binding protein